MKSKCLNCGHVRGFFSRLFAKRCPTCAVLYWVSKALREDPSKLGPERDIPNFRSGHGACFRQGVENVGQSGMANMDSLYGSPGNGDL